MPNTPAALTLFFPLQSCCCCSFPIAAVPSLLATSISSKKGTQSLPSSSSIVALSALNCIFVASFFLPCHCRYLAAMFLPSLPAPSPLLLPTTTYRYCRRCHHSHLLPLVPSKINDVAQHRHLQPSTAYSHATNRSLLCYCHFLLGHCFPYFTLPSSSSTVTATSRCPTASMAPPSPRLPSSTYAATNLSPPSSPHRQEVDQRAPTKLNMVKVSILRGVALKSMIMGRTQDTHA
ncbi:hypothetical protein BHE74_00056248 [Ensete ventricosum]|nr:hypothetical protein BHE74_00056248 [Ensete ventricosum]